MKRLLTMLAGVGLLAALLPATAFAIDPPTYDDVKGDFPPVKFDLVDEEEGPVETVTLPPDRCTVDSTGHNVDGNPDAWYFEVTLPPEAVTLPPGFENGTRAQVPARVYVQTNLDGEYRVVGERGGVYSPTVGKYYIVKKKYPITWDGNGGTVDTTGASLEAKYTQAIAKPANDPAGFGDSQYSYAFTGWNTSRDGNGTPWTEGITPQDVLGNDDNIVFYAQWAKSLQRYTVSWNPNGGNAFVPEGATGTADYGTAIVAPANVPAKAGDAQYSYTFAGWFTAAEGGDAYDASTTLTRDAEYFAHWNRTLNKYTVAFDSQGGSAVDSQIVEYGKQATRPADPVKKGCTFVGWCTSDGKAFDFNTDVTGDVQLVAKWDNAAGAKGDKAAAGTPRTGDEDLPTAVLVLVGASAAAVGAVAFGMKKRGERK